MNSELAELRVVRDYLLEELPIAIESGNWQSQRTLFGIACAITNAEIKADILNNYLLMPGHDFHEEATLEIERLGVIPPGPRS